MALADFMRFSPTENRTRGCVQCSVAGNPGSLGMTKWGFALPCNGVADGRVEPPQELIWTRLILSRPFGTDRDLRYSRFVLTTAIRIQPIRKNNLERAKVQKE